MINTGKMKVSTAMARLRPWKKVELLSSTQDADPSPDSSTALYTRDGMPSTREHNQTAAQVARMHRLLLRYLESISFTTAR